MNQYDWKIVNLPTLDNDIHNLIKIMNNYGNLPFPFEIIASRARNKIITKLDKVKKIHFDFQFFILYGNLIGEDIWFTNTYILDYAPIYFGKNITVGPDVKLITSWHKTENFNNVKALPITIRDNVWLTTNIVVLPGIEIGENSIIGAGSVITKSIPPNVLAAGNPAKVIKEINRSYEWWKELEQDIQNRNNSKVKKNLLSSFKYLRYLSLYSKEFVKFIRLLK